MVKDSKIRKLIRDVVEQLKGTYGPEKIILYGSYAYGRPTADSDVDLFIVKQTEKNRADRFVEVKRLIYDPSRRISISPLVYTPRELEERLALGDAFVEEVVTRGEVLYARLRRAANNQEPQSPGYRLSPVRRLRTAPTTHPQTPELP